MLQFYLLLMIFASIITFLLQRKHLLISLLSLEVLVLTLSILVMLNLGQSPSYRPYLLFVLLTFGACEARLGLSLLVTMTRSFGSDTINLLTISKC